MAFTRTTLLLLAALPFALAAPLDPRFSMSSYAPYLTACPANLTVRPAAGQISTGEAAYFAARKPLADQAMLSWLASVAPSLASGVSPATRLPSVGLASSGGGYRALLTGAGVVQGLDARDGRGGVAGLYQALTYHAGLSGGAWLLSSLAGNGWPPVSALAGALWGPALQDGLLEPGGEPSAAWNLIEVAADVASKSGAGFDTSLVDPWGRLLSHQLLADGGAAARVSGLAAMPAFQAAAVPYPIMTAVNLDAGQCIPAPASAMMETHPYEFGSWDAGFGAFVPTAYLGTVFAGGAPANASRCVAGFDNLGFALGTSSDIFVELCSGAPVAATPLLTDLAPAFSAILGAGRSSGPSASGAAGKDEVALYPNPFAGYAPASAAVAGAPTLRLVDGGVSGQNCPLWPFLQPARAPLLDVLLVGDSSADTPGNFPNGSEIHSTYLRAQQAGLARMPAVPTADAFVARGMNQKATFFGCNDPAVLTIVYLPNFNWTYPSGQPTMRIQYNVNDTQGMIANGAAVASQGGDADWPVCLACAVMKKTTAKLPADCAGCFMKYCYS
jgi:lysophospholipase